MRYMLDTNVVSQLIKKHPAVVSRVTATPMAALCISAITEGELLFGLAKRPAATQLHAVVTEFLKRVDVLPWDSSAAETYGTLRAALETQGKTLAALDMLIGAHAASVGAVLVTNDRAFQQINDLRMEDWTAAE
jgi:tRNA(fMet)-specific endonuclease VapC